MPVNSAGSNICRELWCQSKPNGSCYRTGFPAADGTSCGHKKVCWIGQCIKHHKVPAPSDGSWGQWAAYGGCSQTCGRGVAVSERACNRPKPSFGGRYCVGKRKRYSVCNTQLCRPGSPSFYTQQCSQQNNIPYKNSLHEWLPEILPNRECQLICKTKDQPVVAILKSKVADGTKCKGNGVCINGQCHSVGCDNRIDSNAKMDRCGVCGGNNLTCALTHSSTNNSMLLVLHTSFNSAIFDTYKPCHQVCPFQGYERACHFPVGAQQIAVMERQPSINFLALKTSKKYIINGQWEIQQPMTIKVAGTFLKYWRHGRLESFTALGPINEDLFVYVIFQGSNPGVLCEFVISTAALPHNKLPTTEKKQNSSGTWIYSPWSSCSTLCGSGIMIRTAKCIRDSQIVNSSMCPDQPETETQCNVKVCPHWKTFKWTECSTSCGNGVQTRHVICRHSSTYSRCPLNTKPVTSKSCFRAPCGNWITGSWSECSKQCGTGVTGRKVSCQRGLCDPHTKPIEMDFCNTQPCHTWTVGQWSKCSTSCGNGVKRRVVKCIRQQVGNETSSSQCNVNMKPSHSQLCHLKACPQQLSVLTAGSCNDSNPLLCQNVARLSRKSSGICTGQILSICCQTCKNFLQPLRT
ncbi:LOW QUALITY PROTEIN: A disintegrin and metalloproteinase with thrombospondin motifs 7-like [Corticium candelabrum]|uniref:LOW QUALITY PROTEIN: A disintegrin and metalloproteinase with thrombospondin motifs 7-like n=1 Tax=Corticium candelabrum TaxID=121492 RepID=UPI002E2708B3|nr:LOW QUALITY PROTEIN: A disintegrin and metalloproteinase with thrombospondin motifs 7-like [Corticium candelabrum]